MKKYAKNKTLTDYMLRELVEKIEVGQAAKVDGIWQQKLKIVYHGIGTIDLSHTRTTPPDVEMNTRKGVKVKYDPER